MRRTDGFEETAQILTQMIHKTAHDHPGKPRVLTFLVEGHRNSAGGLDHDSWELVSNFIPNVLGPYLTEIRHMFGRIRMPEPQLENPPQNVEVFDGGDDEAIRKFQDQGQMIYHADSERLISPDQQVPPPLSK
jgi:hypothetical protein